MFQRKNKYLSYNNFLPSISFCSYSKGDCPLHDVLNKICLPYLNSLFLSFLTVFGDKKWDLSANGLQNKTHRSAATESFEFTDPLDLTKGLG